MAVHGDAGWGVGLGFGKHEGAVGVGQGEADFFLVGDGAAEGLAGLPGMLLGFCMGLLLMGLIWEDRSRGNGVWEFPQGYGWVRMGAVFFNYKF